MALVTLGTDIETGQQVTIGDIERRSGLYISGKMGMGKSVLSVNIARQDMSHAHGVFFLDAHGEAIDQLIQSMENPLLGIATRLFDVEDENYSFGINLLACADVKSLNARIDTYTRAYNVFYKLWEEQWGVWLQLILQNVLWAFIENQDYTLAEVPMFLNPRNEHFRNHIIDNIKHNQAVADFWRYEFLSRREQDQQERADAALTRINTLLTHPYVRHIIGQKRTTIDFSQVLSLNNIVLFKLSSNLATDIKKFVGALLTSELTHAVFATPQGGKRV